MFRCLAKGKPSGNIPCGFPSALPFPNPYPSQAMLFGGCRLYSGCFCLRCCHLYSGGAAGGVAFYRRFIGGLLADNYSITKGNEVII